MSNKHRVNNFNPETAPRPKTQTELKRRNLTLSYSDAYLVVEWLNATKGTAAYRRVLDIRNELEELGAILVNLRHQREASRAKRPTTREEILEDSKEISKRAQLQDQFRERHNAFNRLLNRYTFVPAMAYDINTGIWRGSMVPKNSKHRKTVDVSDGQFTVAVDETVVVAALTRLAANRELYKARLCEQCKEIWRVSERQIDRFCSQQCREEYRWSSPEAKEKHARHQRKYREQLKSHPLRNERKRS